MVFCDGSNDTPEVHFPQFAGEHVKRWLSRACGTMAIDFAGVLSVVGAWWTSKKAVYGVCDNAMMECYINGVVGKWVVPEVTNDDCPRMNNRKLYLFLFHLSPNNALILVKMRCF